MILSLQTTKVFMSDSHPIITRVDAGTCILAAEADDLSLSEFCLAFFFNLCGGTLGTAATTGLLYQPRTIGDGDCREIAGMKIGRGNRSTRRKPAPAPLCPPQIPHD
jgi:hypothetical protein